ncbi:DUF6272 family protein [Stanieria cyanosphaera]|nr:DUF6272 family protein [Stanieria cyanosphaera]
MDQVFGDFLENLPSSQEYLIVSFSPSSVSLQQRWRNNGLSADFLADYLSSFLACNDQESDSLIKQVEAKDAISYIANELLENAMKYTNQLSSAPISIRICLIEQKIIFQITNSIHCQAVIKFQKYIKELLSFDPYELYLRKLEDNNTEENAAVSGLGFLTMVNDYGAKLGWKFDSFDEQSEEMTVTTMVQLAM